MKKTCTFAMMEKNRENISNELCRIAGITELDMRFGEPFINSFKKFMPQKPKEVLAASYICSLFLSVIFNKFPTDKLHTFVHFAKEHYERFSFNCKMYEEIFSYINEEELDSVTLLNKEGYCVYRHCSKQDIFEAFDFYTNI